MRFLRAWPIAAHVGGYIVPKKPIVLITGSEGRLGKAIARELAGAHTIVGLERECHEQGNGCINADITSSESLEHALA